MEWTRGPTIGRGSSATVSLATTSSGHLFAVKSSALSTSTFLQKEQQFLSQIPSPYVVKYIGSDITTENNIPMFNLFIEYMPGGTISDVIKSRGGSFDNNLIRFYAHQILLGLVHLHSRGIVHCDIKGHNILIDNDGAKIADLGCARLVEENEDTATWKFSGTPMFMAPEVVRGEEQSFPADIWALGCTVIEMATGSNPWSDMNDPVSALYRIGYSGDSPEIPSGLSDQAKDFLSNCLERDSSKRWTAKQLLEHVFFNDIGSVSKPVEEIKRNSPNSVLNQAFWDSLEVSEASPDPTHWGSLSDDPTDRIRCLIGDGLGLPSWAEDEDWVTVRISEIEESSKFSQEYWEMEEAETEINGEESVFLSDFDAEEVGISVGNEEFYVENSRISDSSCVSTDLFGISCEIKNKINENLLLIHTNCLSNPFFVFNCKMILVFMSGM